MRLQKMEIGTTNMAGEPVVAREYPVKSLREAVREGRKLGSGYGKWRVVREDGRSMSFTEACATVEGFGTEGWK